MKLAQKIRESRLAPIVLSYLGAAWIISEVVAQLIERGILPEVVYRVVLVLFICGIPGALLVAWFHGARGRQEMPAIERWLLVALAVIALGLSVWTVRRDIEQRAIAAARGGDLAPTSDPRRIAVLYFDDFSGGELGFLADGLTETLIQQLASVEPLHVISRNGVKPYRGGDVGPDSIARALQVGSLVEGSVAKSGDRIRIEVKLVDGESGEDLEGTRIEQEAGDLFALQDQVASEVATFLRTRLGEELELRESRARTRSSEAWEYYQRAELARKGADSLFSADEPDLAGADYAAADSFLALAEEADAGWSKPPALRGQIGFDRALSAVRAGDRSAAAVLSAAGMTHAERAVAIDSLDPDAREARGSLRYIRFLFNMEPDPGRADQLYEGAERDLRAAVAENPTQAGAWSLLSHLLQSRSATAEAKLAALRAYESDAYLTNADGLLWRLYTTNYDLEDAIEAKHWCEEGQRRFPDSARFTECRIWSLTLEASPGNVSTAWELLALYTDAWPEEEREFRQRLGRMAIAAALERAGLADSARSVALDARAGPDIDPTGDLKYYEAFVRTQLGDLDEAFELLSAYLAANPQQGARLADDESWWFRDLRSDPRWEALVATAR